MTTTFKPNNITKSTIRALAEDAFRKSNIDVSAFFNSLEIEHDITATPNHIAHSTNKSRNTSRAQCSTI